MDKRRPASPAFASPDTIRTLFSTALSGMYRRETPQYAQLLEIVREVNEAACARDPALRSRLDAEGGGARLDVERHGAIRVGTPRELATLRRLFAVMDMHAVGYYDLSVAGVPVHATAFRPIRRDALARNPFRVFTSLLRLECIEDEALRGTAAAILARREIFTPRLLALIEQHEAHGGLDAEQAEAFVAEALETFRWHAEAGVTRETYERLHAAHRLVADVVCFRGPHINHLTPRTLDIDAAQAAMAAAGMPAKDAIEGPPRRRVPILLRQTSFKALEEEVLFAGEEGTHTARFGEVEQRGIALTRKGRALYDRLLAQARDAAGGPAGPGYAERLRSAFEAFPDDLDTLRREGLAFFRYVRGDAGRVAAEPITYEDFLPVSAAGIFQSNLGGQGQGGGASPPVRAARAAFEEALRGKVLDELQLYEAEELASLAEAYAACGDIAGALREIVSDAGIVTGEAMAPYLAGARYGAGRAACVVRPSDTRQVSRVLALCAHARVQVVPQGANTGLVGASSPDGSGLQVVLSLGRLRGPCEVDAADRTVTAGAGVLLHELNDALAPHGLCLPIDLGADPSVGGMVAANTGGARLIRWGDARRHLLAVEAVLFDPPGEVVRFGKPLRKDNTGFDLKQLFVGTSGAAGIVTRATFEVRPLAAQTATALIVPASDEAVMALLTALERELGDFLTAFEGMSRSAMQASADHMPAFRHPFAGGALPEFAILVELQSCAPSASTGLDLGKVLGDFLEKRFGEAVEDAVLGRGDSLWRLRHAISEGARTLGRPIAFDVSLPRGRLMAFRREAHALVRARWPHLQVVDFGHIADGGLHFNLAWPDDPATPYDPRVVGEVRDAIYDLVVHAYGGSFSAEHGIGPHNIAYYRAHTAPSAMRLAGRIQALLDPLRIGGGVDFGAPEYA